MTIAGWLLALVAPAAAWWLAGRVRRYALARAMLDVPNARSSHVVPTPRGGGAAIAAVVLGGVACAALAGWLPSRTAVALLGGAAVALVGWLDDRRPLSARGRLAVHVLAATWAVVWLGGLPAVRLGDATVPLGTVGGSVLAVVALVWLLNLYNFMDGIDGIAGIEGASVGTAGALLLVAGGAPGLAVVALVVAGACVGFLGWNWSPARLFMGDVGSGFLGYVFGVLALASERAVALPLWAWTVLLGVFVVDATVTLLRRWARGERLSTPHRLHAYQRLVAAGWSHAAVSRATLLTNLGLALAAAVAVLRPALAVPVVVASVAALAALYWSVERIAPMPPRRRRLEAASSDCTDADMQNHPPLNDESRVPDGRSPGEPPPDVSFRRALDLLLRRRRSIIALALLGLAAGAAAALIPGRTYTTSASFAPQSRQQSANVAGIAAQLGVALPMAENTQSPDFYAALLTSREILGAAVDTTYTVKRDSSTVRGDLVALFAPDDETAVLRRESAIDQLRRSISTSLAGRTGVVTMRVTAESPELARDVADVLLGLLNRFNLERRRSQAGEERRFAEGRLERAREELAVSEGRLRAFLLANRVVNQSPSLQFEADGLKREFDLRQQLYATYAQALEHARIEEVRDTPVITIIESPYTPARPDPRGLVKLALVGMVAGLVLGVGMALLRELRAHGGRAAEPPRVAPAGGRAPGPARPASTSREAAAAADASTDDARSARELSSARGR